MDPKHRPTYFFTGPNTDSLCGVGVVDKTALTVLKKESSKKDGRLSMYVFTFLPLHPSHREGGGGRLCE